MFVHSIHIVQAIAVHLEQTYGITQSDTQIHKVGTRFEISHVSGEKVSTLLNGRFFNTWTNEETWNFQPRYSSGVMELYCMQLWYCY
jgi:hypothetical protein